MNKYLISQICAVPKIVNESEMLCSEVTGIDCALLGEMNLSEQFFKRLTLR